jgi:hypothetical protein
MTPVQGRKLCAACQETHRTTYWEKYASDPAWMAQRIAYSKAAVLKLKLAAFEAYGNACACCGETRVEFLSIDHIDPTTAKRGTSERSGVGLYRMLRNQQYPTGYRVLCMNCNFARGHFGYCPHERERGRLTAVETRRAG